MRLTTLFRRLLCLQAIRVTHVELRTDALVVFVDVELQRRTMLCPRCGRRSRVGRTLRQHRHGLLAAVEHGLSNGRLEGLNNEIRLLSHRAYGFHSPDALLALVYLCCFGIDLPLPSDERPGYDPFLLAFEHGRR